jgi:hypothetical protein
MLQRLKKLIAVAAGRETPDLVLKSGRIVNVFSGEIIAADIAISDGFIAGIGSYDGPETLMGTCTWRAQCWRRRNWHEPFSPTGRRPLWLILMK